VFIFKAPGRGPVPYKSRCRHGSTTFLTEGKKNPGGEQGLVMGTTPPTRDAVLVHCAVCEAAPVAAHMCTRCELALCAECATRHIKQHADHPLQEAPRWKVRFSGNSSNRTTGLQLMIAVQKLGDKVGTLEGGVADLEQLLGARGPAGSRAERLSATVFDALACVPVAETDSSLTVALPPAKRRCPSPFRETQTTAAPEPRACVPQVDIQLSVCALASAATVFRGKALGGLGGVGGRADRALLCASAGGAPRRCGFCPCGRGDGR